jgi:microcin C transport system substrate-binding protein
MSRSPSSAPSSPRSLSRRTVLAGGAALAVAPRMALAQAIDWSKASHGLSIFGDLALPVDFQSFGYANVNAPKGGSISLQISSVGGNQSFNTFNSLNMFNFKGEGAAGMGLIFDSLMTSSGDEPDSMYGLVADRVMRIEGKPEWLFRLRREARFHDGSPLTADDVAFSIDLMKTKAHPVYQQVLRQVVAAHSLSPDVLKVTLADDPPRDLIFTVAGLPIFSKAYYTAKNFEETSLEPPLGSSAYKVGKFDVGRFIEFERVADYWGRDLPVARGLSNFGTVRYEYYRDRTVAFEGFKARNFLMRQEFTSRTWATGYDFSAAQDGRLKREKKQAGGATSIQGWWLNLRRPKFQDVRIREAIILAFDYEWANASLMFGSYKRTHSFFENTPMRAEGAPDAAELALLEPFRKEVPASVFGPAFAPPMSDGSGQDRGLLRQAGQLLAEAGCKRDGAQLRLPNGQPFEIEFLDFDPSLQPHTGSLVKNLKLLGVNATMRTVDAVQYQKRMDEFDFDVTMRNTGGSLTPGDSMRTQYHSESANRRGSRNIAGIANPAVDALIERISKATTRADLTLACKALDRVLRALKPMVPAWHNDSAWLAYWDVFGQPERAPRYLANSAYLPHVTSAWWWDEEKAKKLRL